MDSKQALAELKGYLPNYLSSKGIKITMGNNGKSRNVFKCLNPSHDDKHASMGVVGNNCSCFSCGAVYDIIDLIAMDNGLDAKQDFFKVLEIGCNMFGISLDKGAYKVGAGQTQVKNGQGKGWQNRKPAIKLENPTPKPTDYTDYYRACAGKLGACDYLERRGITEGTAKQFSLGYDTEFKTKSLEGETKGQYVTWTGLVIPTGKYSCVIRNTDTTAGKDDRYRKRGESQLYNVQALKAGRPTFIVEGELDALTIEQAGYKAIALGSTSNVGKLLKHFESVRPSNFLLLALDKDDKGEKAQAELKEGLAQLQIKFYECDIAGTCKDANENYLADEQGFKDALQQAEYTEQTIKDAELEAYKQTYAGNRLTKFMDNIQTAGMYNPISTGFKSIDDLLEGGLYAGLYVIGAISSLGKTTFCLQLADQIAENTLKAQEEWEEKNRQGDMFDNTPQPPKSAINDVLIFSLEMSEDEIIAKSISRGTMVESAKVYGRGNTKFAKTTRGILTGKRWDKYSEQETDIIYKAMGVYEQYAQHIKIIEAMGDVGVEQVRKLVQRHIDITGNRPIVIIDYLQILAPSNDKGTDKQNTDKAVLELKKLSRDLRLPVIAISSFNRENYTEPVNMSSFKESGAVEYSSDVLLGLQYDGMDYKEGESQKDKNRYARIKDLIKTNIGRGKSGSNQELQLKVLKNRNGSKGEVGLDFYPMFNAFEEKAVYAGGEKLGEYVSGAGAGDTNWDDVPQIK